MSESTIAESPLFEHEWLHDNRILVVTLRSSDREAVEQWGRHLIELLERWDVDRPLYILHDISDAKMALTPYFREWIERVAHSSESYRGYYGMVLPQTLTAQLIRILLNAQVQRQMPRFRYRTFTRRDEGITWLVSMM